MARVTLLALLVVALCACAPVAFARSSLERSPLYRDGTFRAAMAKCSETGAWTCWAAEFNVYAPFGFPPPNANVQPSDRTFTPFNPTTLSITEAGGPGTRAVAINVRLTSTSAPSVATARVQLWGSLRGEGALISETAVVLPATTRWVSTGDEIVTNVIVNTDDPNARIQTVEVHSEKYVLEFSQRDWSRWSCYDTLNSGLYTPPAYSGDISSPLFAAYAKNFKNVLNTFMGQDGLQAKNWAQGDYVQAWKNNAAVSDRWDARQAENAFLNVTQQCGVALRNYVLSQRTLGYNTDAQTINWIAIPGMSYVTDVVVETMSAWWGIQNMQAGSLFGFFKAKDDIYNGDIKTSNTDIVFTNFPMLVHFAHILPDDFLRTSRVHVGATLTGMLNYDGDYFQPDPSKPETWEVNRIGLVSRVLEGQALIYAFMLRSESILRARNTWDQGQDGIATTDIAAGRFTNDYLKQMVERSSSIMRAALDSYGLVEFQTDYTESPVWALYTLPIILTYAPSQAVYDDVAYIYKQLWRDLSAHYVPAMGDSSAPSHRMPNNYATGLNLGWERISQLQFPAVLYQPMCSLVDSAGCAPLRGAPVAGITGELADVFSAHNLVYRGLLVAGRGYHPFAAFQDTILASPTRVVRQHFKTWRGQDRYNFVADNYTIGTAGVDADFFSQGIQNVARLAGMPTSQPIEDPQATDPTPLPYPYFTPNMISIWTESIDDPLVRRDSSAGGATNARLLNYPISAQQQSFVLHTMLAVDAGYAGQSAPVFFESNSVMVPPLLTDLLVPLGADGLFINGVALPKTLGTCLIIPFAQAILTVRHGSASIVTRLVLAERSSSSNIQEATSIQPCPRAPVWGQYTHSVVWRVDNTTFNINSGRLVVPHRNAGDFNKKVYRVSFLQGGGVTRSDSERQALELAIRQAAITTTSNPTSGWETLSGVWYSFATYCLTDEQGGVKSCKDCNWKGNHVTRLCPENNNWSVQAAISGPGGQVNLKVQRQDYFGGSQFYGENAYNSAQAWGGVVPLAISAQYPEDSRVATSFWRPPITTVSFSRLVNGQEMVFPTNVVTTVDPIATGDVFAPHITPASAYVEAEKQHNFTLLLAQNPGIVFPFLTEQQTAMATTEAVHVHHAPSSARRSSRRVSSKLQVGDAEAKMFKRSHIKHN